MSNCRYVFSYFYYVFIWYFYYVFLFSSFYVFDYAFVSHSYCPFPVSHFVFLFRIYYFIAFYFYGPKARVHLGPLYAVLQDPTAQIPAPLWPNNSQATRPKFKAQVKTEQVGP